MGNRRSAANDRSGEGTCRRKKGRLRTAAWSEDQPSSRETDSFGGLAKEQGRIGRELECIQVIVNGEPGTRFADCGCISTRLLNLACERMAEGSDRQDQDVRVRLHRSLSCPRRCLVKLLEPHMGHRSTPQYAEQKWIERAQKSRVVRGL